jgi:hypothetical protein
VQIDIRRVRRAPHRLYTLIQHVGRRGIRAGTGGSAVIRTAQEAVFKAVARRLRSDAPARWPRPLPAACRRAAAT